MVNLFRSIGTVVSTVFGGVGKTINGVMQTIRSIINTIIRAWNSLQFTVPRVDTPFGTVGGFTIGTPNIPTLHQGGIVPGAPGSDVLTMLQAGERVIPRNAAGGQSIVIQIESFIGSDSDIDRFAEKVAMRLRTA
jgi:hypothetical protein